jgi:predicted amidohydrolase YtcJ
MLRRRLLRSTAVAVTAFALAGCASDGNERFASADLVFRGGTVYTLDSDRSFATAAAIRGGTIVAVGADSEVERWVGPNTELVELAGRMLLPGFHDLHVHPVYGGVQALGCSLEGETSIDATLAAVRRCDQASRAEGGWLRGSLWDLGLFPDGNAPKQLLDEAVPDRPVYLMGSDGHSVWVNSAALEIAGIDADSEDPPLGVIERDPQSGEPSGTLRESAIDLVRKHLPEITDQQRIDGLTHALLLANSFGITSLVDAAVGELEMSAYKALADSNRLSVRALLAMEWGTRLVAETADFERLLIERLRYDGPRIDTGSVKIFIDGVLEGETAALVEPYVGRPGHLGTLNFSPADIDRLVTRFDAAGLQVHMHAIGDGAVRVGLDAVAAARRANGLRDNRHQIAHLQLIHPEDLPRFAELDVSANFQALWALPDSWIMGINLPVVGPERVNRMYPIASLQQAGGRIVAGSDWDVSSMNPLLAIQVALTRQDPAGGFEGVLNADERVDLATMLAAYTINGAHVMRHEARTGSIEVGKAADLIVLEQNLFELAPEEIGGIAVVRTLIDGETVYRSDAPREREAAR